MSKAAKQEEQPRHNTLPLAAMAGVLQLTPRRLQQLVEEGHVPAPIERGTYAFVPTVQGFLKYLKDDERRNSQNATQNKVLDARAREIELRVAERTKELISLDDALATVDSIFGSFRSALTGVPSRVTRDTELRGKVETEMNAALSRASDRIAAAAAALRAGRDPLEAHGDGKPAKAKRTGGQK